MPLVLEASLLLSTEADLFEPFFLLECKEELLKLWALSLFSAEADLSDATLDRRRLVTEPVIDMIFAVDGELAVGEKNVSGGWM